jgi:hypothetical protein
MKSRSHSLILIVALIALPLVCWADDKEPAKGKYAKLVSQLASPNKEPETSNRGNNSVWFPKEYDFKAQERIGRVRKLLQKECEAALPVLAESLADDRYCYTMDFHGDGYYNITVGGAVEEIIATHLEIYRDQITFDGPAHWNRFRFPNITKEWLTTPKVRSLVEMQLEAIDWAIERCREEQKEGLAENADKELAALEDLRKKITKTGKPVPPAKLPLMATSDR